MVKKHGRSTATTAYEEFPGRAHFIVGQQGWEDVADHALTWATENANATRR